MTWFRKRYLFRQVHRLIHSTCCEDVTIRVRFAPSPTGSVHVGGLRTALYNYLFARSNGGVFVLRIEDTDQTRLVPGAVECLEEDLHWAGLDPDEGPSQGGSYGPYFQSERLNLYRQEVDRLLEKGHAYYCFCTEKRLDLLRRDALRRREQPKYDNRCRSLAAEELDEKLASGLPRCVRFKLTPYVEPFDDLVYGPIRHNVANYEGDPVIMKNDGYPTYHLANVVDDHYMRISHVLRGVEWQPSTTKHLLLFRAFGWDPPQYAHIPLLLNEDGKKLSKRNGECSVRALRQQYIYPKALTNLLVLYGGGFFNKDNPDITRELEDIDNLCSKFSLDMLRVNSCQFPSWRLKDFNRMEMKRLAADETGFNLIVKDAKELILNTFPESKETMNDEKLREILRWGIDNGRLSYINELIDVQFSFLWIQPVPFDATLYDQKFFDALPELIKYYEGAVTFERSKIANHLRTFAAENELNFAKFMKFLRACLSGLKDGPSIAEMVIHLGKEEALRRLRRTLRFDLRVTRKKLLPNNKFIRSY